ncbi:hypothetical protein DFH07DRAFT_750646 [Mycena maculata]|uniref:Uncharacterized protein n=1 Tax=Mycena maculata TaxID=230809 RepID=A0AAD7II17_9AGAR|nr:hypothetical protein DFH07DRAFT_750646 [Mycena maculata]
MTERLKAALQRLNTILPNELTWENSRRKQFSYLSIAYTWYYRMGQRGHGAPPGVHPNKLHHGVKVNFSQRVPYSSVDTVKKAMEFETLCDIFAEVLEFQRINFQRANPGAYKEVRVFADVLPLNAASPAYPFAGFMINFRVVTDAHKDSQDSKWCLIIFVKDGEGGHLCLHELGLKLDGKTGNIVIFPSCWITHFNCHFKGVRLSLVLHTDKAGDDWAKDSGGWAGHVVRHNIQYSRD